MDSRRRRRCRRSSSPTALERTSVLPLSLKKHLRRTRPLQRQAFRPASNQGLEGSFCHLIAWSGLRSKECIHRHRSITPQGGSGTRHPIHESPLLGPCRRRHVTRGPTGGCQRIKLGWSLWSVALGSLDLARQPVVIKLKMNPNPERLTNCPCLPASLVHRQTNSRPRSSEHSQPQHHRLTPAETNY
jgi:hypothetical protein